MTCLTPGAVYEIEVSSFDNKVTCKVFFPHRLELSETAAKELQVTIHIAMEAALAILWQENGIKKSVRFGAKTKTFSIAARKIRLFRSKMITYLCVKFKLPHGWEPLK